MVDIASPAPLTMQPIVPSRRDERQALLARRDVDRVLLVEVAHQLEVGVASERRVVDRDLRVEALERLAWPVGAGLADDGQRVDLHQVGVVVDHRLEDALGDGHEVAQVLAAEAHLEGQLARLVVEQPQVRVGVDLLDRVWSLAATSSISTPPSAEPMSRTRRLLRSSTQAR